MELVEKTTRLIAIGVSITANCQPCLQINITKALEEGIGEQEITGAIKVGKMFRRGAVSKMDQFMTSLNLANPVAVCATDGECGCSC
jgi:AhpD family alkylhydroperoxidase